MQPQTYADTLDEIIESFQTEAFFEATAIDKESIYEIAGYTNHRNFPAPYIAIGATPDEQLTFNASAATLSITIFIGAEADGSAALSARACFELAGKVMKYIDDNLGLDTEASPLTYWGTEADRTVLSLNYQQPFIVYNEESV